MAAEASSELAELVHELSKDSGGFGHIELVDACPDGVEALGRLYAAVGGAAFVVDAPLAGRSALAAVYGGAGGDALGRVSAFKELATRAACELTLRTERSAAEKLFELRASLLELPLRDDAHGGSVVSDLLGGTIMDASGLVPDSAGSLMRPLSAAVLEGLDGLLEARGALHRLSAEDDGASASAGSWSLRGHLVLHLEALHANDIGRLTLVSVADVAETEAMIASGRSGLGGAVGGGLAKEEHGASLRRLASVVSALSASCPDGDSAADAADLCGPPEPRLVILGKRDGDSTFERSLAAQCARYAHERKRSAASAALLGSSAAWLQDGGRRRRPVAPTPFEHLCMMPASPESDPSAGSLASPYIPRRCDFGAAGACAPGLGAAAACLRGAGGELLVASPARGYLAHAVGVGGGLSCSSDDLGRRSPGSVPTADVPAGPAPALARLGALLRHGGDPAAPPPGASMLTPGHFDAEAFRRRAAAEGVPLEVQVEELLSVVSSTERALDELRGLVMHVLSESFIKSLEAPDGAASRLLWPRDCLEACRTSSAALAGVALPGRLAEVHFAVESPRRAEPAADGTFLASPMRFLSGGQRVATSPPRGAMGSGDYGSPIGRSHSAKVLGGCGAAGAGVGRSSSPCRRSGASVGLAIAAAAASPPRVSASPPACRTAALAASPGWRTASSTGRCRNVRPTPGSPESVFAASPETSPPTTRRSGGVPRSGALLAAPMSPPPARGSTGSARSIRGAAASSAVAAAVALRPPQAPSGCSVNASAPTVGCCPSGGSMPPLPPRLQVPAFCGGEGSPCLLRSPRLDDGTRSPVKTCGGVLVASPGPRGLSPKADAAPLSARSAAIPQQTVVQQGSPVVAAGMPNDMVGLRWEQASPGRAPARYFGSPMATPVATRGSRSPMAFAATPSPTHPGSSVVAGPLLGAGSPTLGFANLASGGRSSVGPTAKAMVLAAASVSQAAVATATVGRRVATGSTPLRGTAD